MSALPRQKHNYTQLGLFEPAQYHDTDADEAFFALLLDLDGKKAQISYPLSSMHEVLRNLDHSRDTWISQAEFWCRTRRLVHLLRLGLCFSDCDTYKIGITGSPEHQTEQLLRLCERMQLPEPSLVVFSGRGLQVKWLFDGPIPARALPRWNAVQRVIHERLQPMGADPQAMDASRVLRLVETVNTKSGEMVRVVHHNPVRYDFNALADTLLPLTRKELQELRDARARGEDVPFKLHRDEPTKKHLHLVTDTSGLHQFQGYQLAWDRLADLRKLAKLRGWHQGAPDGSRDPFIFLSAVFLTQALVHVPRIYDELRVLGKEFAPHWREDRVRGCASGALKRLQAYIQGERIPVPDKAGTGTRMVDPRYRFKTQTLIEWLGVTPAEERELGTIISTTEAKRRDAARAQVKRLAAGAVTREAFLDAVQARRQQAQELRAQGLSIRAVAASMGVSVGAVAGYLKSAGASAG